MLNEPGMILSAPAGPARRGWISALMAWACCLGGVARAHVHVQIGYGAQGWDLGVYDFDAGAMPADQVVLPVAWQARREVPAEDRFTAFLGEAGRSVWVLPEIEADGVLFLGVGTSRIGSGVFSGDTVQLRLHSVEGPGTFAVYSVGSFGAPLVHMSSADGIRSDLDRLSLPAVGGHRHVNWAFGAAGRYRVGFVASGQLRSGGAVVESAVVHFTFEVIPPPPPRLSGPRIQPDGRWVLDVETVPGVRCRVLHSLDLIRWEVVAQEVPTRGRWLFEIPRDDAVAAGRFWKAELP